MEKRPPNASNEGGVLAQGPEPDMERCINKYAGLVWSIASRYVKDRASVERVVQETFTEVQATARRSDPSLATNRTFIGLQVRRRALAFARKEAEPLPKADIQPDEQSGLRPCRNSEIRLALENLPPEVRELLQLHFAEGMTNSELVAKTGLPEATVKARLRVGLLELRDKLDRSDRNDDLQPHSAS